MAIPKWERTEKWVPRTWSAPLLRLSTALRPIARSASWFVSVVASVWIAIAPLPLQAGGAADSPRPLWVVSNSWLESALVDVASTAVQVERLAPPGACPGHYDIRPDEALRLTSAQAVVLFDFQQSLARRLREFLPTSTQLLLIRSREGLCVPESYAQACRQLRDALVGAGTLEERAADAALSSTLQRVDQLAREVQQQTSRVRGLRVVTSIHQAAFCRWLGPEVVASWQSADASSAKEVTELLDEARRKSVHCVIANLQEGGKVGASLAEALAVPLVVFSNFPAMTLDEPDFDSLVRHNVSNLLKVSECGK